MKTYNIVYRGPDYHTAETSHALLEHDPPPSTFLRLCFLEHRKEILAGDPVRVVFPGFGSVVWNERQYTFTFESAYAARMGLPREKTGRWGTTDDRHYKED